MNDAAISPDAQWAFFDTGTCYIENLITKATSKLSTAFPGFQTYAKFSADSRFLAYPVQSSLGTNQVYLYDLQTGTSNLVSQSYNSTGVGNGTCDSPDISLDGSLVAYRSAATNLVPNDTNGVPDIFLYNRLTGGTTLISVSQFGAYSANGRSSSPAFSGDGQTLFFKSWASDLAPDDFNESSDVFAVSLSSSGSGGTSNAPPPANITGIVVGTANGQFSTNQPLTLTWSSGTGVGYQVQFKNNRTDPTWLPLNAPATVVGGQGSIIDFSPAVLQRFYRVVSF
jgi:Tol biopolymer transport system component